MKEFLIAITLAILGAGLMVWWILSIHQIHLADKGEPKCVLIASIKTDSYNNYGMVAFRRNLYLNQYQCGSTLKTIVE